MPEILNNIDLSDFFVKTPDLVWYAGTDGYLKKVNRTVVEKLGYTEEELFSRPISDFIYPADVEKTLLSRARLLNGEVLHNFCNRYLTKQGDIVWLEWTSIYMPNSEIVLAIAKDITARKKVEYSVQQEYDKFRSLASHFKNKLEKDSKYFAYELHEEIAQLAFAISMDVSWLNANCNELSANAKERMQNASEVCKLLISTIQRLAFSISPQMLDDCGLKATLEWLCNQFSVSAGIPCTFESNFVGENDMKGVKIDYFRICQEVLFQIIDQSRASKIKVSLMDTGSDIGLFINDSGDSIGTDLIKQSEGLVNIKERANSINGKVTIHRKTAAGTGISVKVIKPQKSEVVL